MTRRLPSDYRPSAIPSGVVRRARASRSRAFPTISRRSFSSPRARPVAPPRTEILGHAGAQRARRRRAPRCRDLPGAPHRHRAAATQLWFRIHGDAGVAARLGAPSCATVLSRGYRRVPRGVRARRASSSPRRFILRAFLADEGALPRLDSAVSATAPLRRSSRPKPKPLRRAAARDLRLLRGRPTRPAPHGRKRGVALPRWGRVATGCAGTCVGPAGRRRVRSTTYRAAPVPTGSLLHGRTADLVNIAGKRTSLAHLNLSPQFDRRRPRRRFHHAAREREKASRG